MAGGGKEETGGEKKRTKGEKGGEGRKRMEGRRETCSFTCARLIGFNSHLLKGCKRMGSVAAYLDAEIFLYTVVQYSYSVQWNSFFDNIFCEL